MVYRKFWKLHLHYSLTTDVAIEKNLRFAINLSFLYSFCDVSCYLSSIPELSLKENENVLNVQG